MIVVIALLVLVDVVLSAIGLFRLEARHQAHGVELGSLKDSTRAIASASVPSFGIRASASTREAGR